MLKEQRRIESVELLLPAGVAATFRLQGQVFGEEAARCYVVKDAGDDPDVTHGVEVHAEVRIHPSISSEGIVIEGGQGIGRVTKPGLAVPVGESAINPVPRRMVTEALREVFADYGSPVTIHCRLSIPDGEERAKRTLNARLGILGGLSILGTSGIVRPISHQAWTDTLESALDVARAGGCETVVLSTGRTSELAAQKVLAQGSRQMTEGVSPLPLALSPEPALPEEAFIMMGDHVGYALEACHRRGFPRIVLAAQFAKLVKIACGHARTHVSASRLELGELAGWCRAGGLDEALAKKIECANTAREVYLGAADPGALAAMVAARALAQMRTWAPGAALAVLLVDYDGASSGFFGDWPGRAGLP